MRSMANVVISYLRVLYFSLSVKQEMKSHLLMF